MGYLSASYFYGNVLFLFIAGFLIDHLSRRIVLIIACFINVCAIFFFAAAQAPWQVFICHFISGFAETFSLTATIRLVANWFSREHLAGVIGVMAGFAALGGIVAQLPFTTSIEYWGWRNTLLLDVVLGVLILLAIIFFVQDQPHIPHKIDPKIPPISWVSLKKSFKAVARNFQNWLLGIYAGIMTLPLFLLGALWGNLYLTQAYGFGSEEAALITSLLFVGGIIGAPSLGWVSDYWGSRKKPMQIVALVGLLLSSYMLFPVSSTWLLCFLFFFLGFIVGVQSVAYSLVTEINRRKQMSSSQGFVATIMMMAGFLQSLFSFLVGWQWNHRYVEGTPLYSIEDYHRAMIILPVAFLLAFIVAWKMPER